MPSRGNIRRGLTAALLAAALAPSVAPVAEAGPYETGQAAYLHGDYGVALKYWRPEAEKGDANAQNGLGVLYFYGEGVARDPAEAKRLFLLAAAQGHAKAQGNLALAIADDTLAGNDAEALRYAIPAAEQDNGNGLFVLGTFYYTQRGGLEPDDAKAFAALVKASAKGVRRAQGLLGELYASGRGTEEDHAVAYAWFKAALQNGTPDQVPAFELHTQLDRLIERSTAEEIERGEKLAERCIQSQYQDCGRR